MDLRLYQTQAGTKLQPVRREDLPRLAHLISLVNQGTGTAAVLGHGGAMYVFLRAPGLAMSVPWADWQKVMPYVRMGTFDANLYPLGNSGAMYDRILTTLQGLFSEGFPED